MLLGKKQTKSPLNARKPAEYSRTYGYSPTNRLCTESYIAYCCQNRYLPVNSHGNDVNETSIVQMNNSNIIEVIVSNDDSFLTMGWYILHELAGVYPAILLPYCR